VRYPNPMSSTPPPDRNVILREAVRRFVETFRASERLGAFEAVVIPHDIGAEAGGGKRLSELTPAELRALADLCGAVAVDSAVRARPV
jgi:hypothetical protein